MPSTVAPPNPTVRVPGPGPSTAELVEAACRRDAAAWAELFRRYENLVRSVVAAHRLQEADAADAVQNTWVRAVERLHTLHDPDRLGGWLRTTARRECLEVLRRTRRERPAGTDVDGLVATDPGPEATALVTEAHSVVGSAVARLPHRRRDLIQAMFYRRECGYAELAREMGMPIGSLGPTRRRALQSLHTELVQVGYLDAGAPV